QLADYMGQLILGGNLLMMKICKDFGISDPSFMIPEPLGVQDKVDAIKKQADQAKAQMQQRQLMQASGAGSSGQAANTQLPQVQAEGAPGQGTTEPQVQ